MAGHTWAMHAMMVPCWTGVCYTDRETPQPNMCSRLHDRKLLEMTLFESSYVSVNNPLHTIALCTLKTDAVARSTWTAHSRNKRGRTSFSCKLTHTHIFPTLLVQHQTNAQRHGKAHFVNVFQILGHGYC